MIRVGAESPDYEPTATMNYDRTRTEMLSDLHVLVIPLETWRRQQKNAVEEIVSDAQSAGYIRVNSQSTLNELRRELSRQIGSHSIPREFVFLRPVGRYFTQVSSKQEQELKAKYFLPPQTHGPELYLLDSSAEEPTNDRTSDELNPHTVLPAIGATMPDYDDTGRYDYDNDVYDDDNDYNNDRQRSQIPSAREPFRHEMTEIEEKKRLKELEEEEERLRQKKKKEEEERRRKKIAERVQTPSPLRRPTSSENDAEYQRIQRQIEKLRDRRQVIDKMRDKLTKHSKALQQDYFHKRHDARDTWKKKYFEEKKKTFPKEELLADLHEKLSDCHRKEVLRLETAKDAAREAVKKGEAERDVVDKANMKIHSTKLKNDIEDLSTRLQNTKMRLTAEMKLRNQSENELQTMKRDRAIPLKHFNSKDDFTPTNENHLNHSPRREKRDSSDWLEPHHHRKEKKPTFAVRQDQPQYKDDNDISYDMILIGEPSDVKPKHEYPDIRHHNRKPEDDLYPAKVKDEEHNFKVTKDDPFENVCRKCRFPEEKRSRPKNELKHNCPTCHRKKASRRNKKKKDCSCSDQVEGGKSDKKRQGKPEGSRKRCEHCNGTDSSSSSSSDSDSSSSSSSSEDSSSSSDSDSDSSSSSHSSDDERKKPERRKPKHKKGCTCHKKKHRNKSRDKSRDKPRDKSRDKPRDKSREKKRDKSRDKKRDRSPISEPKPGPERPIFDDKPKKDNSLDMKRAPTPERNHRQEIQHHKPHIIDYDRLEPRDEIENLDPEEPKPIARKAKIGNRSPKLAKKPVKDGGAMNNPRGRPYRPGDLEDAFRTFATRANGREATNADIVKWCTDAEILGKNLTTQHIDISFSKIKPKGSKTIARKDIPSLIDHLAYKYKEDHKIVDLQQAKREVSEKLANAPFKLHQITNALKAGAVQRLTDTSKYTGMHKNRFDDIAKGKGKEANGGFDGYVANYKMAGTYDNRH